MHTFYMDTEFPRSCCSSLENILYLGVGSECLLGTTLEMSPTDTQFFKYLYQLNVSVNQADLKMLVLSSLFENREKC